MKLSVVIPCYKSGGMIEIVLNELHEILNGIYDYEVILVNDCSPDDTWNIISHLVNKDNYHLKGINLSKNSGQHAAILTGMRYSKGDYVAVIDDDGQTPSYCIPDMIKRLQDGYDVVCAKYEDRNRKSILRSIGSFMAIKMSKWLLNEPEDVFVTVFFVAKRFVVEEIIRYDQPYPYIMGLLLRTTSKITNISVDQRRRMLGKSGYSFKSLLSLWLNGFTAFSIKPLQLASYVGVLAAIIGFVIAVVAILRKLLGYQIALGWSSMMVVMLVLGGFILLVLGLLGEYVGRIYLSINRTPQSIVRETLGFDSIEN